MNRLIKFVLLKLLFILPILACGAPADVPEPPGTPATPVVGIEVSPDPSSRVAIVIEEIKLSPYAQEMELEIGQLSLIPFDGQGQFMNFEGRYIEENALLTRANSYRPSSPWDVSATRAELGETSLSLWFVISSPRPTSSEIGGGLFEYAVTEYGPLVVASLIAAATPIPGDEAVSVGLLSRKIYKDFTAGNGFISSIVVHQRDIRLLLRQMGRELLIGSSAQATEDVIEFDFLETINLQEYVTEAYVNLPYNENWYANRRLSVITTDGALEIIFRVEEPNAPELAEAELSTDPIRFDKLECNPEFPSGLVVGASARVLLNYPILNTISGDPSEDVVLPGDLVSMVISHCDRESGQLWWQVRYDINGEERHGWLPEFNEGVRVLEDAS
jgi:hypothetical protein